MSLTANNAQTNRRQEHHFYLRNASTDQVQEKEKFFANNKHACLQLLISAAEYFVHPLHV